MSLARASRWMGLCVALHTAVPAAAFAQGPGGGAKATTVSLIQRGAGLFEDQAYEESIQALSAALVRPGASDKEKVETYRLLAYNFIILKRTEEADASVRGILVLDESFSLPPSESPRFRDFFTATKDKWIAEGKPGKVVAGAPVEKPISMAHSSPPEGKAGQSIRLSGTIDDPDGRVRGVQIAYRTGTKGRFITAPATYTLGAFAAVIPAAAVKPPLVEYYLQAIDKGGLPLAARGDSDAPLRVVVPGGGVLTSPFFWVPVGVVVVGGAIATAILVTRGKTSTSTVTVGVRE